MTLAAYVLHGWDWSESSLIVELWTRPQGRVVAVAKGAKRPYSQLRAVLLPFQRLHLVFSRPRPTADGQTPEVLTLRSADYAGAGAVLPPARLMAGFYCNELLLKLLARNDPHEALFDAYADTLAALAAASGDADEQAALRAFELQMLSATGVLPELDRVTQTQTPLAADSAWRLHAEHGVVAATEGDGATLSGHTGAALQTALAAADGQALRSAARGALAPLKTQLRPLLHYHLAGPQLRTRQLMLELRRLSTQRPPAPAPFSSSTPP